MPITSVHHGTLLPPALPKLGISSSSPAALLAEGVEPGTGVPFFADTSIRSQLPPPSSRVLALVAWSAAAWPTKKAKQSPKIALSPSSHVRHVTK